MEAKGSIARSPVAGLSMYLVLVYSSKLPLGARIQRCANYPQPRYVEEEPTHSTRQPTPRRHTGASISTRPFLLHACV
jgi:hypothetical protein